MMPRGWVSTPTARNSSKPDISGNSTSRSKISGFSLSAASMAAKPQAASPTTCTSSLRSQSLSRQSRAGAWSSTINIFTCALGRGGSRGEIRFQLVERTAPALFMAAARLLVVQLRMHEDEFCPFANRLERDLDPRFARVLRPARPAPAQDDPSRPDDFEKLAAALVLGAVELTEAYAIAAADARIGLRHQHGSRVGTPPLRDSIGGRDCIEYGLRPRPDAAYQRETRHGPFLPPSGS